MRFHLSKALPLVLGASHSYIFWRGLSILTNCPHPIVVVTSESMAPAFHRGDILFLWNRKTAIQAGDIPVIWFPASSLPMVHRAIAVHWSFDDHGGESSLPM